MADELERWVDEGGVDGFNLADAVTPGTTTDVIDSVLPELRRRGRAQTSYAPGTMREKRLGTQGWRVEPSHPAAAFHGADTGKESVQDGTTSSGFEQHELVPAAAE